MTVEWFTPAAPPTLEWFGEAVQTAALMTGQSMAVTSAVLGPPGPQGEIGKSAYEVWLDQGNTGSEQDFLQSLETTGTSPDDILDFIAAIDAALT